MLPRFWICRLRHRGPDWSGLHCHENCYLAHQRLAIVDPASGDQPLYNEDKTVVVTVSQLLLFTMFSLHHFGFTEAVLDMQLLYLRKFSQYHQTLFPAFV